MKTITMLFLFIMLISTFTFSGEIYGSLKEGESSVGRGIRIEITSPRETYATETEEDGSYRLFIREEGKCTLKVHYEGQAPKIKIYSYEDSVRYDLVLEEKDGEYVLRRK